MQTPVRFMKRCEVCRTLFEDEVRFRVEIEGGGRFLFCGRKVGRLEDAITARNG